MGLMFIFSNVCFHQKLAMPDSLLNHSPDLIGQTGLQIHSDSSFMHWIGFSHQNNWIFYMTKNKKDAEVAGYLSTIQCRKQNWQMSSIIFQQQSSSIVCTACEQLCTSGKDNFISIYVQNSIIKGETPLPGATLHNFPHLLAWLPIVMHYLF